MHNSSRLYLVASEQEWLQPSPFSISRSSCNVKPPRKQEELKAPDRDSTFKGFNNCKKRFVKSACLKGDLEEKCWAFYASPWPQEVFRCSPVSHDRLQNFGTHAAQVEQEIVPSSEQGGTHVKARGGSRHVKACAVIPTLWLSLDTVQCTWIKTALFTVPSSLIESLSRLKSCGAASQADVPLLFMPCGIQTESNPSNSNIRWSCGRQELLNNK